MLPRKLSNHFLTFWFFSTFVIPWYFSSGSAMLSGSAKAESSVPVSIGSGSGTLSLICSSLILWSADPHERRCVRLDLRAAAAAHGEVRLQQVRLHPRALLPEPGEGDQPRHLPRVPVTGRQSFFLIFSIPVPNYSIPDTHRKYDRGCSSRIRILGREN